MKILLIQPGASYSTDDLYRGIGKGLQALGHEVFTYRLDNRIGVAWHFLYQMWRQQKKDNPDLPKPTNLDILYYAGQGVLETALREQVDWVIIVSSMYVMKYWVTLLKRARINVGIYFTESPYDDDVQMEWASEARVCWTNERTSVAKFRTVCPHTYYLPPAYDPDLHRPDLPVDDDVPAHDVVFVGTGFKERIEVLEKVDWTGIDFGLYGQWQLLGSRHPLRKHLHQEIVPREKTAALYRKAKIGLNLHRTSVLFGRKGPRITGAESLNPRAYELAASGCFQISDYRAEMDEELGFYVPNFISPVTLEALIRTHLAMPGLRADSAEKTLDAVRPHTYLARAEQMLADIARVEGQRETAHAALA